MATQEKTDNWICGNDFDDDDKINYKQWVATNCTTLACIQSTVDEFIQTATEMIWLGTITIL